MAPLNLTTSLVHLVCLFLFSCATSPLDHPQDACIMKSKGYRLSMSSWNKVYDNEDWFFNTESCVLLD